MPKAPEQTPLEGEELLFAVRVVRSPQFPDRIIGLPWGAYGGMIFGTSVEHVLEQASRNYRDVSEILAEK